MTAIRRPGASSVTVLFVLGACFVLAHLLAPDWCRRAGLDVWNLPSARVALHAAADERAEVAANAERCARRREAANQVAAKLAVGTVTLSVATDEVMEVFRDDSGMPLVLGTVYPDAPTMRHRFARNVIDRVKRVLSDEPDRCAVVLARLENEYRVLDAAPVR
jgi:hypothetical protein